MPKTASAGLLAAMAGPAMTICYLMKVGPLPDGNYVRVTSLDRDIDYDDGDGNGVQTYYASTGMEASNLNSGNDLNVNNGEVQTLTELATYPNTGVTEAMVNKGDFDGVEYVIYKVSWSNLALGHIIEADGPIGEVTIRRGGLVTMEVRSWTDKLRQLSVCEVDSLSCRVKHFGSQVGEERFPCGYDLTGEWVNSVAVTAVGSETVRDFTASSLLQATDYFTPALITWVTGDNAGLSSEVASFTSGGAISLLFAARYPVQVGDTFNIRRDCTRQWTGNNSCETYFGTDKGLHFRGEPHFLVADVINLTVPGAGAGGLTA